MYSGENNQYVRNPQGLWVNTAPFRQEGINFMKNKYYCADPAGSPAFMEYWTTQLDYCVNGFSSGGTKITGDHYFYLNFCPIMVAVETGKGIAKKMMKMPDFWDGDYNYFWAKHIARYGCTPEFYKGLQLHVTIEEKWLNGGHHMVVGKARRKGYSYKNAAICVNRYNTERNSLCLIGAFDKKYLYPKGTMGMASHYLSFLNKNTAWRKAREAVDKQDHRRASFIETVDGFPSEQGYQSEIMAISFKDNPDAARGKDATEVLLEESGAFPNLLESIDATGPGLTAGDFITGMMTAFGTGGDMKSGTKGFAQLMYNPAERNFLPFINVWDENAGNSSCGFFHPVTWNMEGHYDGDGNSDIAGATAAEEKKREELRQNASSSAAMQSRVQEWPFNPSEAFLTVSINDFPTIELRNQLNKVLRENLHLRYGQPVDIFREEAKPNDDPNKPRKVVALPILDDRADPIWRFNSQQKDLRGNLVIFEYPTPGAPKGLYKIGFDPYRQAQAETSTSLASFYVYKGTHKYSEKRNEIVAVYVGRPYDPDTVNRLAELTAELYNAEIMYENEVTHVKDYFRKVKKLHLLAAQPDAVISNNIKNSKVARVYGIHMNDKLKDAGEKYLKAWLLEEKDTDEHGNKIINLETIYDPGLLEELISYNRKGNFDRVMSFMMVMFFLQEDELGKVYDEEKTNQNAQDLLDLMKKQFKRAS